MLKIWKKGNMCIYKRLEREKKFSCRRKVKRGQKSLAQQPEYEKGKKCNGNKKGERKKKCSSNHSSYFRSSIIEKSPGDIFSPQI